MNVNFKIIVKVDVNIKVSLLQQWNVPVATWGAGRACGASLLLASTSSGTRRGASSGCANASSSSSRATTATIIITFIFSHLHPQKINVYMIMCLINRITDTISGVPGCSGGYGFIIYLISDKSRYQKVISSNVIIYFGIFPYFFNKVSISRGCYKAPFFEVSL